MDNAVERNDKKQMKQADEQAQCAVRSRHFLQLNYA
jgi:hypothetical protein